MNAKEREAKKKELYRLSWETKWKRYKELDFHYSYPCSFCKESIINHLKCLVDSDLCCCYNISSETLFSLIDCEENLAKRQKLIERMALEIKKRGGIVE